MTVAEATTHVAWWREYLGIVRNPAHYLGEFTIETIFAVIGVHAAHKVAHSTVHAVIRRARTIGHMAGRGGR